MINILMVSSAYKTTIGSNHYVSVFSFIKVYPKSSGHVISAQTKAAEDLWPCLTPVLLFLRFAGLSRLITPISNVELNSLTDHF